MRLFNAIQAVHKIYGKLIFERDFNGVILLYSAPRYQMTNHYFSFVYKRVYKLIEQRGRLNKYVYRNQ